MLLRRIVLAFLLLIFAAAGATLIDSDWRAVAAEPQKPARLDPAAWGSDHVGQEIPTYLEGGECLFCHRSDVGGSWSGNKHNRTIRDVTDAGPALEALKANKATKDLAAEARYVLGDTRAQRFLKPSDQFGKLDLLSVVARFGRGSRPRLEQTENPHWDTQKFNQRCAGCHATAVDPETTAIVTVAHDCYVCHGDATEEHANEPALMALAKERKDAPRVVVSICAQCHIRSGKSESTGRPYPNNFVAGDNLFRDFRADLDRADDETLNPADRHVLWNIREVAVLGREDRTCLSCHDVHAGSSARHRELAEEQSCQICHEPGKPKNQPRAYEVHSELCEY